MDNQQKAGAVLASLFLPAPLTWFFTAKLAYGFTPQDVRQVIPELIHGTFTQGTDFLPLKLALGGGALLGICAASAVVALNKQVFAGANFKKFYRGTELVSQKKLARLTKESHSQVTIAGVPIPYEAECTHIQLTGSTGTGKSTLFNEIILTSMKRGDRQIILDPDGGYLKKFWRKGDKILNPYDGRSQEWSFFNEIRENYDFERYAESMIQTSSDSESEEWNKYGRLLFREVAKKLYRTTHNPTVKDVFNWTNERPVQELAEFVRDTPAVSLFTGNDRATGSARFVLSDALARHLDMPHGSFSLRDWLDDPNGGNLFITWKEDQRAALTPLISTWTDTLISSILSMGEDESRRIWLYIDELESLNRLPNLGAALTKARKYGLRIVCGYQNYTQVEKVYGDKPAETMVNNIRTVVALATGRMGTSSAEMVSKSLGEHEIERSRKSRNHKLGELGSQGQRDDLKIERVVMASELARLPNLEGFLSFPGDLPVARIKYKPIKFERTNPVEAFVSRNNLFAS